MDKDFVLEQIRVLSIKHGGRAPGKVAFEKATGIKESDWAGKYWVRWSDAVSEAGLSPNVMNTASDRAFVVENFISLVRELGKFPTVLELKMKARSDSSFPSHNTFTKHLGKQFDRAESIKSYCEEKGGMEEVIQLCKPYIKSKSIAPDDTAQNLASTGYVYLLKSGKYYKIGKTNKPAVAYPVDSGSSICGSCG